MGGKNDSRHRKSSFSLFSMFKSRKTTTTETWEDGMWATKVYPSDEDRRYCWVAEPGIDHRASAFIASHDFNNKQSPHVN
ncbi:hypothetical protein V2J09_000658 [Rumex salicifolius]